MSYSSQQDRAKHINQDPPEDTRNTLEDRNKSTLQDDRQACLQEPTLPSTSITEEVRKQIQGEYVDPDIIASSLPVTTPASPPEPALSSTNFRFGEPWQNQKEERTEHTSTFSDLSNDIREGREPSVFDRSGNQNLANNFPETLPSANTGLPSDPTAEMRTVPSPLDPTMMIPPSRPRTAPGSWVTPTPGPGTKSSTTADTLPSATVDTLPRATADTLPSATGTLPTPGMPTLPSTILRQQAAEPSASEKFGDAWENLKEGVYSVANEISEGTAAVAENIKEGAAKAGEVIVTDLKTVVGLEPDRPVTEQVSEAVQNVTDSTKRAGHELKQGIVDTKDKVVEEFQKPQQATLAGNPINKNAGVVINDAPLKHNVE